MKEKQSRYMTPKEGLWFAFSTVILFGALYLVPILHYAQNSRLLVHITSISFVSCLFMFFWRVRAGEIAWITILGFDTGLRCGSGGYLMPALLPFLRAWDIILGFGAEVPTVHHEGNTTSIRHLSDQRMARYQVNMQASLLAGKSSQILGNIFYFLIDLRDADGRVKYYKLGGYGYVTAWMIAVSTH